MHYLPVAIETLPAAQKDDIKHRLTVGWEVLGRSPLGPVVFMRRIAHGTVVGINSVGYVFLSA